MAAVVGGVRAHAPGGAFPQPREKRVACQKASSGVCALQGLDLRLTILFRPKAESGQLLVIVALTPDGTMTPHRELQTVITNHLGSILRKATINPRCCEHAVQFDLENAVAPPIGGRDPQHVFE